MAKSFFGSFLSKAAKAADKAIAQASKEREKQRNKAIQLADKAKKLAEKQRENERKKAEKENLKLNSKTLSAYGNIHKPKNKNEADQLNKSFRQNDMNRMSNLDFVVGFEIKRSNNKDENCFLCEIGEGKYPKDFNWTGWHNGCKCHTISILLTDKEYDKFEDLILAGKDTSHFKSLNTVHSIPSKLKEYVQNNQSEFASKEWFLNNKKHFV